MNPYGWEYMHYTPHHEELLDAVAEQLNYFGAQGWEAFAIIPLGSGPTAHCVYILKRPIGWETLVKAATELNPHA